MNLYSVAQIGPKCLQLFLADSLRCDIETVGFAALPEWLIFDICGENKMWFIILFLLFLHRCSFDLHSFMLTSNFLIWILICRSHVSILCRSSLIKSKNEESLLFLVFHYFWCIMLMPGFVFLCLCCSVICLQPCTQSQSGGRWTLQVKYWQLLASH